MADLRDLLRYLERDDVTMLVLQTGSAISVEHNGQLRRLTRDPLAPEQMADLIEGTPILGLVPAQDSNGAPTPVELFGGSYRVEVARRGDKLRLKIARSEPAESSGLELETNDEALQASPRPEPAPAAARPALASQVMLGGGSLDELLSAARAERASDVHITSERPAQMRVSGYLRPLTDALPHRTVEQLLRPLLGRNEAQLDELGYADFSLDLPRAGRMRVNVNRHRMGLKGCFRLVSPHPPTLEELGLPEDLMRITNQHQGLVVIAGPNGSGKTTTLGALVDWFNTNKAIHIITVEDPVEIVHPVKRAVISQREVGSHTRSFASALKGSLREDPDVLAIGELRDRDTVEMALSAAETGHLVLATMSTPSGAKTIDRLIELFPPDDQAQVRATMAGALKFVVSQRLVPAVDGGMAAAVEMITGNIPLWKLIRDNKLYQLPSLQQRGRAYGMLRVEDTLADLVRQGRITVEAAMAHADDPRGLEGASRSQSPQPRVDGPPPRPPMQSDTDLRERLGGGLKNLFRRKDD
ncbi:MAG: PilT/PilU family type 4a pilus ATPase [Myxococcales bacterium]|nr:PilT/PilU family type 4a pilus ATPase [Myxococcales bacterium]